MFGEEQIRTLLGPADPTRNTTVAPPRLSARDLIACAEASAEPGTGRRHARPTRRLVLAAGAVAIAASASAVARTLDTATSDSPKTTSPQQPGTVLVPIAYQFDTDAPPASAYLRALAERLVDAPYENHTGRYMYHHSKTWGGGIFGSGDGHDVTLSYELKLWQTADGSGKQIMIPLEPQYPDQESRDYWQRYMRATPLPALDPASGPSTLHLPPGDLAPLPSDRAGLSAMLNVEFGGGAVPKQVNMVYGRYVVPRQTRVEILRVLADVPGFVWRGEVTDRAGRKGVAITFDDREHDQQDLLIFDPKTGELLAQEHVLLTPKRLAMYELILGTDRTNQPG